MKVELSIEEIETIVGWARYLERTLKWNKSSAPIQAKEIELANRLHKLTEEDG